MGFVTVTGLWRRMLVLGQVDRVSCGTYSRGGLEVTSAFGFNEAVLIASEEAVMVSVAIVATMRSVSCANALIWRITSWTELSSRWKVLVLRYLPLQTLVPEAKAASIVHKQLHFYLQTVKVIHHPCVLARWRQPSAGAVFRCHLH